MDSRGIEAPRCPDGVGMIFDYSDEEESPVLALGTKGEFVGCIIWGARIGL